MEKKKGEVGMELLQLRYFYASARTENFSATATLFQVPTTAVSSSIRRLEKELGCSLFDRTANRVTLNPRGQRLQQALCVALGELDRAVEELSVQPEDKREIRVLVRGMRREVTALLSQFHAIHPEVAFQIAFHEEAGEQYDVMVDEDKECYGEYRRFELYSMALRLKCAAGDSLCRRELTLEDLCDRAFVSMGERSNMHRILTQACVSRGFHPKIAAVCNDIECYDQLIAMGMGIGIGRERHRASPPGGEIANLQVTDFNARYTVYVYYRPQDYFGNLKRLVDFARANRG